MYTVHLRATRQEFAPENIVIFAGINELNHPFVRHCLTVLAYAKATLHLHLSY